MKTFLENLLKGIDAGELNSEQKEALRNLETLNAVTLHKNRYYLNDGFICGKLDISMNGTGYINVFNPKFKDDALVENKDLGSSKQGDIVLAKILKGKLKNTKSRIKAKIMMTIKPAFATSVAYTKKVGKEILGVNIRTGLASKLKASQKSLKQLPPYTVLKIDNQSDEIVEILGVLDDVWVDEKISLGIYNKNDEFSTQAENEAKSFGDIVDKSMYPQRTDLTSLNFVTIDPVDAKDFDDAVCYDYKNRTLYVAIADVSEYVLPYSATDKEAKFRGFSIYFPHRSIPMLPRNLSENICSLKPNLDRLAFCFKITLDENLEPVSEELKSVIINSKIRFNYDEVDEILSSKTYKNKEILDMLLNLATLTKALRKKRLKSGFDFHTKELRITLDESGNLKSTRFETSTPSHDLIEDCMLLANKAAAKMIQKGIFRNHGAMDDKKLETLMENLMSLGVDAKFDKDFPKMIAGIQSIADEMGIREEVDKLIIKAQKKAEYAVTPLGHFGLGFDLYTHFTSPIRRYSDLLLHRLLKATLNKDEKFFNYLLLNIESTCESLNTLEREADKVAFDFIDRKFARWALENLGKNFRCYIDTNESVTTAKLDDKLKGGRVFITNYTGEILTPVLVELIDADIINAKIYGRVIKKLDV
ncbi:RNB domain-containing ribonuclease [Campylobacter corcagiensis]|uniref:VacB/RNase II family 3'-5' exoribonuclease n=1 Tax=Campylobacter corcagiensis TaxID=1448857 RepID=A0A7M1LEC4_9BACT|nr:ribonuclease R family protein [Campylobacter corcagiensis]QKF64908.1 ribonuclease R [Campylobacter corcagiensis]QOQ86932.1 VacB/RNase II family 3'-5' exoribonuclease [Campylobacter corcagiensis]